MTNSIIRPIRSWSWPSPLPTLALVLVLAGAGPGLSAHASMDTIVGHHESGEPVRVRDVMVEDAKLAKVRFQPKADLSGATFPGADLSEAVMDGVDVRNALFLAVKLSKTRMRGADLSGTEFRKGQWESPDQGWEAKFKEVEDFMARHPRWGLGPGLHPGGSSGPRGRRGPLSGRPPMLRDARRIPFPEWPRQLEAGDPSHRRAGHDPCIPGRILGGLHGRHPSGESPGTDP